MPRSYNGWPASRDRDSIDVGAFTVRGVSFPAGVRRGDVATVFRYLVEQFDLTVEDLELPGPDDEWGHAYRQNRNADNLSCHGSGTAVDLGATRHPNGRRGTFTAAQVRAIRKILAFLEGVVKWGGDFNGTPDEMHFEIDVPPGSPSLARVADKVRAFFNQQEEAVMAKLDKDDLTAIDRIVEANVAAAVVEITGGPRKRDGKGDVVDPKPAVISAADVYTLVEDLRADLAKR